MAGMIEELENAASLCGAIGCADIDSVLTGKVLESVTSFLGADSGVFRLFSVVQDRPELKTLRSLGVPNRVDDAYLSSYIKLDPARQILKQRLSAPLFANEAAACGWRPERIPAPRKCSRSLAACIQATKPVRADEKPLSCGKSPSSPQYAA